VRARAGYARRLAAIEQLSIGADPAAWSRAGFDVEGAATIVGTVRLEFGDGDGITGWRLVGAESDIDGLA
jgi:hypothetical protein